MRRVDDMSAPEDRTFVIRLNRRFGLMLEALAKAGPPALCIMPERLAVSDPFQQVKEVIGSGPFKWVAGERLAGARAVYERFDGYRPRENGTPDFLAGPKIVRFDRVEWHIITDPATSAAALQTGEIDWWENPPNDLLSVLEQSPNVATERINTLGVLAMGVFNCRHPPFDNPAVRRLVLEAVTQADFMTAVAGTDRTLWRDGVGLYPPGTPMASDVGIEAITRKRDFSTLRELLRKAGYRGERVVLMAPADQPVVFALSEVGRDLLHRLGIEVDYAVSSWGTVLQRRAKKDPLSQGGWSMFYTTWAGLDMLNPIVIQPLRANGDDAWFGWPDIPKIQALLDQWTDAPDLATQQHVAAEIQGEALSQAPFIPVGQYFSKTAYNRSIKGIARGTFVFWNVHR
jgi:peptide/nickel transport system substrate-binding protein